MWKARGWVESWRGPHLKASLTGRGSLAGYPGCKTKNAIVFWGDGKLSEAQTTCQIKPNIELAVWLWESSPQQRCLHLQTRIRRIVEDAGGPVLYNTIDKYNYNHNGCSCNLMFKVVPGTPTFEVKARDSFAGFLYCRFEFSATLTPTLLCISIAADKEARAPRLCATSSVRCGAWRVRGGMSGLEINATGACYYSAWPETKEAANSDVSVHF